MMMYHPNSITIKFIFIFHDQISRYYMIHNIRTNKNLHALQKDLVLDILETDNPSVG